MPQARATKMYSVYEVRGRQPQVRKPRLIYVGWSEDIDRVWCAQEWESASNLLGFVYALRHPDDPDESQDVSGVDIDFFTPSLLERLAGGPNEVSVTAPRGLGWTLIRRPF